MSDDNSDLGEATGGWQACVREADHEVSDAKEEFKGGGGDPADFDPVPVAERVAEEILSEVEIVRWTRSPNCRWLKAAGEVAKKRAEIRKELNKPQKSDKTDADLPMAIAKLVVAEDIVRAAVKGLE